MSEALDELARELGQRTDWIVCAICGRAAKPGTPHWLSQPHKDILGLSVQRCPQHWTDWALRQTIEGRTNANRQMMGEALAQPVPTVHPYNEPWSPTVVKDEDAADPLDDVPGRGFGAINARAQAMKIMREQKR